MSVLPRHPYRDAGITLTPLSAMDVNLESLRVAGRAVAGGLIAIESLHVDTTVLEGLVAGEFSDLPIPEEKNRNALASSTMDTCLQRYAKDADPKTAWAIFDLTFLVDLDNSVIERAVHWPDPAGIIAPFIANSSLSSDQLDRFATLFAKSSDRSRCLCAAAMMVQSANAYLRGVIDSRAPDLTLLAPSPNFVPTAIAALIRHLALQRRLQSSLVNSHARAITWLTTEAVLLRSLLSTGAAINEVLRDGDENVVFIISILVDLDLAIGLERAAKNRLLQVAEAAFFARFSSILSSADYLKATSLHFRPFEFNALEQIVKATGLDPYRFEETFLALASDGYFRLLKGSGVYESERSRGLHLVALAALASKYTANPNLLDAARRCNEKLQDQRFGGRQLIAHDIAQRVRAEVGLTLPS